MSEDLKQATSSLVEVEGRLGELLKEQQDIIKYTSGQFDFGPDFVLFPFAGR
jgi:hypothetical protein